MSEFNNSKWDATNWTTEQKARWQEKCFELGYKWCGSVTTVGGLSHNRYYIIDEKLWHDDADEVVFINALEVEKQYEDMFPVGKLVYISPDSFDGQVIIATLGKKGAEEFLNGEGMTLNLPIKSEIAQLLNQVFCTQSEVTITPPETQKYFKRTDYELQIGEGLCLADLTEEQKVLLAENFAMYDDGTLSWCDGYIYWVEDSKFVGCKCDHPRNLITFDTLFNEVSAEAVKDDEPEHIDIGFDGLVYVPPTKNVYIKVDTLSEEQLEWFICNVPFSEELSVQNTTTFKIEYCTKDKDWYFGEVPTGSTVAQTTFNEVFKESK